MSKSPLQFPQPLNEPVLSYAPGESEREEIKKELEKQRKNPIEIPLIIGGKEIRTKNSVGFFEPHRHASKLATVSQAEPAHVEAAIANALDAKKAWEKLSWIQRGAIFLKAADLLAGPWRAKLNVATMLGQSKSVHQAEIDSACELIDFWRFNAHFMERLHDEQPLSIPGVKNSLDYRPLEGFVFAVTPFNFTAIGGNLPTAPALLGNVALWKPAATSALSNYYIMKILEEAGLPPGVINFLPGPSAAMAPKILAHRDLAGVHFTGSTGVFNSIWRSIGENLEKYKGYPRIVGETGGKDFVFAHPEAQVDALATGLVRGAFEYQGQKCSAASRAYIPRSLWPKVREKMLAQLSTIKMGDVSDFSNYINAVIDEKSFTKITGYIERARASSECKIIAGGEYAKDVGYFIRPTVIETTNPNYESMRDEIFGPVLTIFVYEDAKYEETLALCDNTSPYALTGAFFSQNRSAIDDASEKLRYAAGNFYINDKPTGAVVGQQPFGGARASGTNDKAGSFLNLVRWTSPRTIKETEEPATDYRYPFLGQ